MRKILTESFVLVFDSVLTVTDNLENKLRFTQSICLKYEPMSHFIFDMRELCPSSLVSEPLNILIFLLKKLVCSEKHDI